MDILPHLQCAPSTSPTPTLQGSPIRSYVHNIPAIFLLFTTIFANYIDDTALVWFGALMLFRYWRTITNIWFHFQYELATMSWEKRHSENDCTVIVPIVGPEGNCFFDEMVTAILVNGPARLIFSTNTPSAKKQVEDRIPSIIAKFLAGTSEVELVTEIKVLNAEVSNERKQVVKAFDEVEIDILVMVDDTAIW
jgi:hypothetical protein